MTEPHLRIARPSDSSRIIEIYNHYIANTAITFDLEPYTEETRRPWFEAFAPEGPYRLFVLDVEGVVMGYASSTRFRKKAAYDTSVETSIYLAHDAVGRGFGRHLYGKLLKTLEAEPMLHRAYAGVTLPNPRSVAFHESFGFRLIGTYHEVGFKFGAYHDVAWFERAL
ncbi:MAG TPA: N-acetyltransferase family protein [Planctomycetes bacterium]|nr:N-acetyltransferase family protein [Planctomycetota bacterium]